MICATFGSVMATIAYVVVAIIVLLTMVLIHELGHYIVGRILGFKIVEFSIGFGKAIWQRKNKRGELISIRVFPLGGFCAFYGESEGDEEINQEENNENKEDNTVKLENSEQKVNEQEIKIENSSDIKVDEIVVENEISDDANVKEQPKKFNDHAPWKRILVFFAGVTFNFISAFIFSIIFLCVGGYNGYLLSPSKNPTTNLAYEVKYSYFTEDQQLVVGDLEKDTIVYAVNGENINFARGKVFDALVKSDDETIVLTIDIDGVKTDVLISKDQLNDKGESVFGIEYQRYNIDYNFGDVLRDFVPFTFDISFLILKAFWQIITGKIALNQLGGPISTVTQMTSIASAGLANFLYLLPLLAANLAIFNILPIPGLDGAHVIFTLIEWIRKKPIKRDVENAIHAWGIIILFAFVIIIDIIHLITV